MNKLSKIFFKITYIFLLITSYLNHRIYMRFMNKYLKRRGATLNGTPRYIGVHVRFDNYKKIKLGDRVVISDECHLLTHDYSITTALISIGELIDKDIALDREIQVGNNVFIGKKSIIMPNTIIGNNVIIGAGSVVRGRIADNSIVIGNPGEIIGDIREQAEKWKKYLNSKDIRIDK